MHQWTWTEQVSSFGMVIIRPHDATGAFIKNKVDAHGRIIDDLNHRLVSFIGGLPNITELIQMIPDLIDMVAHRIQRLIAIAADRFDRAFARRTIPSARQQEATHRQGNAADLLERGGTRIKQHLDGADDVIHRQADFDHRPQGRQDGNEDQVATGVGVFERVGVGVDIFMQRLRAAGDAGEAIALEEAAERGLVVAGAQVDGAINQTHPLAGEAKARRDAAGGVAHRAPGIVGDVRTTLPLGVTRARRLPRASSRVYWVAAVLPVRICWAWTPSLP